MRQVYTTDVDSIYDDSGSEDGTLLEHLDHEMEKLTTHDIWHAGGPDSTSIEAHVKVASKPFSGVQFFRLSVRPPGGGLATQFSGPTQVSFQFTCRSGIGVQVLNMDDHVDLLIALNSAGYHAPPLPPRQEDVWTKERLDALNADAAELISFEQVASILTLFKSPLGVISLANAEQALYRGVKSEHYDIPDVDILNRSSAVPFVNIDAIPGGEGVVTDDNQPYPVFGYLEIRRKRPDVVLGV